MLSGLPACRAGRSESLSRPQRRGRGRPGPSLAAAGAALVPSATQRTPPAVSSICQSVSRPARAEPASLPPPARDPVTGARTDIGPAYRRRRRCAGPRAATNACRGSPLHSQQQGPARAAGCTDVRPGLGRRIGSQRRLGPGSAPRLRVTAAAPLARSAWPARPEPGRALARESRGDVPRGGDIGPGRTGVVLRATGDPVRTRPRTGPVN